VFINGELLQIKARTLLLIGREEVIYNPEAAVKRLAQLIWNIETEILPNAGHGLPMEQ
jgi:pimeloyl-ACP methyl ester carboxylesterase